METLQAWARTSARGRGWYWLASHMRNGDLYCVCSLAKAFKEVHGGGYPLRIVVSTPVRAELAGLFSDQFDEIIVEPGFSNLPLYYWEMNSWLNLANFGLDTPIVLLPHLRESIFQLTRFTEAHGGTWMDVYKYILQLPDHVEPAPPAGRPETREAARLFCEEHGVVEGRSVILFPYAQSLAVDGNAHFAALARSLTAQGYSVFTSVAPGEGRIDGTVPVFIPFPLLRDVVEHAGWAVAVRSGISDLLSSARCRKTFIYRWIRDFREWSVAAMDLASDAYEIVFNFGVGSAEAFVRAVEDGDSLDRLLPGATGLSALIGQSGASGSPLVFDFPQLQRRPDRLGDVVADFQQRLDAGGVVVVRKLLPPSHPSWGGLAEGLLDRLVADLDWRRTTAYVCRDRPSRDFFERVEPRMLARGLHTAATGSHTVVLAGGWLRDSLPGLARQFIVPLEYAAVNETIAIRGSVAPDVSLETFDARPAAVGGVQLLSGWGPLEDWGVWSVGLRSLVKLSTSAPVAGARIVLVCRAVVSPAFPAVEFEVSINGETSGVFAVRYGEGDVELTIDVPESVAAQSRSLLVAFNFAELQSPFQQGMSVDSRLLGIGLVSMRIEVPEPS